MLGSSFWNYLDSLFTVGQPHKGYRESGIGLRREIFLSLDPRPYTLNPMPCYISVFDVTSALIRLTAAIMASKTCSRKSPATTTYITSSPTFRVPSLT